MNQKKLIETKFAKYTKDLKKQKILNEGIEFSQKNFSDKEYIKNLSLFDFLLNTSNLLLDFNANMSMILALLLYKLDEDQNNQIKEKFGKETLTMIIALRKIDEIKKITNYEIDHDNFKKILVALSNDYRVVIIRLVLQMSLMKLLDKFNKSEQIQIIDDSLYVFSPLAHRLGIFKIKNFLENKALLFKDSKNYKLIEEKLKKQEEERMKAINKMKKELIKIMKKNNIEYSSIKGRPKQIYSIYKKMKNKSLEFEELYDLLAIRIITKKEVSCYEILGHVHTIFKPIQGKFKDYIAVPKPNMYQSLHTSVVGKDGNIYEIQIRTEYMDEVAESGVAAHWRYKEGTGKKEKESFDEKLYWFKDYIDDPDNIEDIETLKKNIFDSFVAVLTPRGKVIDLPVGATPIDFAYKIHSKVGDSCIGAIVNGKMKPLDEKLQTGDVVEIRTSKIHTKPSEDWLKFVKTTVAKSNIKKALLNKKIEENKEQLLINGKKLLIEQIKKRNLDEKKSFDLLNDKNFLKQFSFETMDALYLAIVKKAISPMNVTDKIRKIIGEKDIPKFEFKSKNINTASNKGVIVQGVEGVKVSFAKCCSPLPGDKIVGFISRGNGVKIHRKNCEKIKGLKERLINVSWDEEVANNLLHRVDLVIVGSDRSDLLIDIMKTLSSLKINVLELNASSNTQTLTADIHLSISVQNNEEFKKIKSEIKKIKGVFTINRMKRY